MGDSEVCCTGCNHRFAIEDGIPLLYWPNEWEEGRRDVTGMVREFYEETPFPNYEDLESVGDLVQKARRTHFARLLNEQVPFNIRVLEVGCGTGQLSNYLGVAHRHVVGVDLCFNSLRLANRFRERHDLRRVSFAQMNLFRPIFRPESFPLVICNGVLHHTADPFLGFQSIARLVRRGGYILVGLYNTYGRLITDARRIVFRVTGDRFRFLDPRLRAKDVGETKKLTWFADQYKHPHESKHTIGEVLRWFKETGFDFVYGLPKPAAGEAFSIDDAIFEPHNPGNWFDHLQVQTKLFFTGSREGGFFLLIGRKRDD